jgi:cytochrome c
MSLRTPAFVCLGLLLALAACGPKKSAQGGAGNVPAGGAVPPELNPAGKALIAALPAPYNTGDPVAGERIFTRCRSCHTTEEGAPDLTGPNLWGVYGRKAGSKAGYVYSDGMKTQGYAWDAAHLDKWLERPAAVVPGTKMAFVGLPSDQDRKDVIAYLKVATSPLPAAK